MLFLLLEHWHTMGSVKSGDKVYEIRVSSRDEHGAIVSKLVSLHAIRDDPEYVPQSPQSGLAMIKDTKVCLQESSCLSLHSSGVR